MSDCAGHALHRPEDVLPSDIAEFKRREAELARRTAMLEAVTCAATRIIGQGDWQSGVEDLLDRLGLVLGVARAGLHQVHSFGNTAMQACLFEWTANGVPRLSDDPKRRVTRLNAGEGWAERLRRGETVQDAAGSQLLVPIIVDGAWWGHIAFDDASPGRTWSELETDVLSTAAVLLAGAIQRARLDAELRRSEARKQAIVETALDCILTVDASGLLVEFNPAAERTLGYRRDEVLGRRMEELIIPPAWREAHRAGFARYLAGESGGTVGRRLEVTAMRADGSEFPAELSIAPSRVAEELFFTATLRDITTRKQGERDLIEAKAKAEAAAQAKSAFLNTMSHELRTPLNAIIGFSEIIKDQAMGPLGSPMYLEYAKDIHESGGHLLRIINDVLDMSRIEAGKLRLAPEAIDLGQVVHSCLQMVRDHALKGEVALLDDVSALPLAVHADRLAVMKILLNLLSNAVKFTPPGGSARVSAALEADGTLVLTVADTGVGIAPDALKQVFEPFQQGDMALNRRHGGTGLGLAITRALVELHGGGITLTSEPGQGTTATVRLPTR
ncbi:MAG TPA: ATP-binding protein [Azospirillum sp.]|nr:ATP-binding protein [Azospirillum sp.]